MHTILKVIYQSEPQGVGLVVSKASWDLWSPPGFKASIQHFGATPKGFLVISGVCGTGGLYTLEGIARESKNSRYPCSQKKKKKKKK